MVINNTDHIRSLVTILYQITPTPTDINRTKTKIILVKIIEVDLFVNEEKRQSIDVHEQDTKTFGEQVSRS